MLKVYEFHWTAKNRFQQKYKGKWLATSKDDIEKRLLAKGYIPIKIQRNFILSLKPSSTELSQFINQFSVLINASLPLRNVLIMLLENVRNIKLYLWLDNLIRLLESGYTLSKSLEKSTAYFTKQEIQLIRVGESSGKLGNILKDIAHNRIETEKLRKKIQKIIFYPLTVLVISLFVSFGLLVFIVPQFVELYSGKTESLPFITKIIFETSDFLRNFPFLLILFVSLVGVLGVLLFRENKTLKNIKWKMISTIPVFNRIIKDIRIIFFSKNLSLMLNTNIRIDSALKIFLSEKSQDPVLTKEVENIVLLLQQGYSFGEALNPDIFDFQTIQMIVVGEKSGHLVEALSYINHNFQQQLDHQIEILSQLLEPFLMVIIGLIIGTLLMGLYLPIFDMGNLLL